MDGCNSEGGRTASARHRCVEEARQDLGAVDRGLEAAERKRSTIVRTPESTADGKRFSARWLKAHRAKLMLSQRSTAGWLGCPVCLSQSQG